jgi:hypothetical protein
MTFSIGQNFFNDLLQSSEKTTHNDEKAIEQTYQKQIRLNDFWVNNGIPVLLKSKEYSGMVDLLGKQEPSGGQINWQRCGARNAPGSCVNGCPDEYAFWGSTNDISKKTDMLKKENFENKVLEQPKLVEKFTVNDIVGHKENFSGKTSMTLFVVLIVLLVVGLGGYLFLTRNNINKVY